MFHVKLLLFGEVLVDASFAKDWIHAMVVANENVAELFLSVKFFVLFRLNFVSVLVNEAV